MSSDDIPEFFVESVQNVSHANGVFRVVLARNEGESNLRPILRVMIPANQLSRMLQGLGNAAAQIGEKVKEQIGDQSTGKAGKEAKPASGGRKRAPRKKT